MRKQYILYIVAITMLFSLIITINNSYINDNNVSALDYSSDVGIGFTFNPTLSVSLSSSDLFIPNLAPGTTEDSNSINVSVATNAAYGYTLSATIGDSLHNDTNLTHTNNTDVFSGIATNADLSSLDDSKDTNIWGYSYKDNTAELSAWSNYNGLSSSSNAILLDNSNAADSTGSIDFKIGAKAGNTQPSGEYTNTINFIAVSKVAPMSLLDSFIASGAEQLNGYYKMQDMTHDVCNNVDIEESELQLIDVRDNKVYWVAKLKDGNCWMTQNLDLDLSHEVALTSETSDIDPDSYGKTIYTAETGYSKDNETNVVSWLPSTIDSNRIQRANTLSMDWTSTTSANIPNWVGNKNNPYSADAGDRYHYTDSVGNGITYVSFSECSNATNDNKGCQHAHIGNYYNWSAAVASNNTEAKQAYTTYDSSICPKNWNLPTGNQYGAMLQAQEVWTGSNNVYATDGFLKIRTSPLYFIQSSRVTSAGLSSFGSNGGYYSNRTYDSSGGIFYFLFDASNIQPNTGYNSNPAVGRPLRCVAGTS